MIRAAALALLLSLAPALSAADPIVLKPVKNNAFKAGEKLEFLIKYEFVSAGTATMEIQEGPIVNGRPTLNIMSTAKSNSMIDKVFRVRDFNGSNIDKESLATFHFHQNLKEGKYHVVRNTSFDYANKAFRYERISKGKTSTKTGELNETVQDVLSSFFVTRTLPLELGKQYEITVFSGSKVYPLVVRVHTKLETVKVEAGKFECIRIEPAIQGDSIFKASEGAKMSIWVTNDHRHLPVLIRSKVSVGAFDAELSKHNTD